MKYEIKYAKAVPVESITLTVTPEELAVLRFATYQTLTGVNEFRQSMSGDLEAAFRKLYPNADLFEFWKQNSKREVFDPNKLIAFLDRNS
jgi:hypothetical protein